MGKKKKAKMLAAHMNALPIPISFIVSLASWGDKRTASEIRTEARKVLAKWDAARSEY